MTLEPNWVMVAIDLDSHLSQIIHKGIIFDKRFDPYAFATSSGEVVAMCDRLEYEAAKTGHEARLEYDSPIELVVGDKGFFNFLSAEKAIHSGRLHKIDGKDVIVIRYDRFYGAQRGDHYVGVNGWKLMVPQDFQQDIYGNITSQGIVVAVGLPVGHYWDKRYRETGEVKKGDVLTYTVANPIDNILSDVPLRKCQERDILTVNEKPFHDVFEIEPVELPSKNFSQAIYKHLSAGIVKDAPEEKKSLIGQEIVFMGDMLYGANGKWYVKRVQEVISYKSRKLIVAI